jgi:hypothetical protein
MVSVEYDPDDPRLIEAAEKSGLAAEYRDDPRLLRFYMRRLLRYGWAGTMTATEIRYTTLARRAYGKGMSAERIAKMQAARQRPAGRLQAAKIASMSNCTDPLQD